MDINNTNRADILQSLNSLPVALVIIKQGQIVYANERAKIIKSNIDGEYLEHILGASAEYAKTKLKEIQKNNGQLTKSEYKIIGQNGTPVFIEASGTPITYLTEEAALVAVHDITTRKEDLLRTAAKQMQQFHINNTLINGHLINTLYHPCMTIGDDFYFFSPTKDGLIGVIGDVSGKGSFSAMMISSFEALFHQATERHSSSLKDMVAFINTRFREYFDEQYIAALFFSIEPDNTTFIGAGINHLNVLHQNNTLKNHSIKGPFLGMMDTQSELFETLILRTESLKQFMLFSDGYDLFKNKFTDEEALLLGSSSNYFLSQISYKVNEMQLKGIKLSDDLSLVIVDINSKESVIKEQICSPRELSNITPCFTKGLMPKDQFNVHLILSELVTNAYKFGNNGNEALPIHLTLLKHEHTYLIKVSDANIHPKKLTFNQIDNLPITDEGGRGLFIIRELCDLVYYDSYSVYAKYKLRGE